MMLVTVLALMPVVFVPVFVEQISDLNLDFQLLLQQLEEILGHRYIIAGPFYRPDSE